MSSDPSRNRRLAERMLAGPDPLSLDAAAHPPRSVAGYDVLRVLGRGGAGVVLEARRPGVEERVAIKWLTGAASTPAQRRRLWREADALREIRHPHVARVRELGQHEGAPTWSSTSTLGQPARAPRP
ncbi:MAG: hypothetical protein R3F62_20735 [Planctomycetota bacterium]